MANRSRLFRVFVLAAGLALTAFAPSAAAGLLTTAAPSACDTTAEQPFSAWGDDAYYVLMPGGSFESGTPSWTLSGGASVVGGNEPYFVASPTDSHSLRLPAGSSALSPTSCFATGDWHFRFFVRNVGAPSGALRVDVVVRSLVGGLASVLDGGTVTAGGEWEPSPRVKLTLTNVTALVGTRAVAIRLRASGTGAAFQVDDVHLDPWKFW